MGQSESSCPPGQHLTQAPTLRPAEWDPNMYQSLRSYVGKNAKLPGYMDYLHLSTADVAILKGSWSVLEEHVTRVGVDFFIDMMTNHGEIKAVFRQMPNIPVYELKANEDLNRHGMYILGVIKKIVGKIDDTEYLEKLFDDLSDLHRRLGVEASGMDIFCKVMRPILLEKKKWKPEIKDSWMTFFSSIVKVMKKSEKQEQNQGEVEDEGADRKYQVFRRNTFDRHLIEVGCDTFSQLFARYPVLDTIGEFDSMEVHGINVGEDLRSHAAAIGSVVGEIEEHAGSPERIRLALAQAGHRRWQEGVARQQLELLGPILAHVIRPLVWVRGLWSIELEKAWTHLFDIVACLMKLGYPQELEEDEDFPNLAETVILKDTWGEISRQVKSIGMEAFEKVWSVNSDMSVYLRSDCELEPGDVERMTKRIRGCAKQSVDTLEKVISVMPDLDEVANILNSASPPPEPGLLEVVGPVFCNSTRHFLLIQGRWSLDVENAWLSLHREMSGLLKDPLET